MGRIGKERILLSVHVSGFLVKISSLSNLYLLQLTANSDARQISGEKQRSRRYAFAGLKVADFAWVGVGPITQRVLSREVQ